MEEEQGTPCSDCGGVKKKTNQEVIDGLLEAEKRTEKKEEADAAAQLGLRDRLLKKIQAQARPLIYLDEEVMVKQVSSRVRESIIVDLGAFSEAPEDDADTINTTFNRLREWAAELVVDGELAEAIRAGDMPDPLSFLVVQKSIEGSMALGDEIKSFRGQ